MAGLDLAWGRSCWLVFFGLESKNKYSILYKERNFFGMHKVVHDSKGGYHLLFHGTTLHGAQSLNPVRIHEPLTYFYPTGPLGQVFVVFPKNPDHAQVAIIGVGTGSTAGYDRPGQHWIFYEIDPAVVRIAKNTRYFTFPKDCPAKVSVVLGDARLSLANAPDHSYDLIVLDAFSSDAIPIHLLTREALKLYLSKLSESGVMLFHISNRYLDLKPILGNLANHMNLVCLGPVLINLIHEIDKLRFNRERRCVDNQTRKN